MKYIKSLFESIKDQEEYDEAINFCEESLAYLLDKGFKLRVNGTPRRFPTDDIEFKITQEDNKYFNWSEIKDDFISFAMRLNSEYYLSKCQRGFPYTIHIACKSDKEIESNTDTWWSSMPIPKNGKAFTVNQLEKTKILDSLKIDEITFTIKNKRF